MLLFDYIGFCVCALHYLFFLCLFVPFLSFCPSRHCWSSSARGSIFTGVDCIHPVHQRVQASQERASSRRLVTGSVLRTLFFSTETRKFSNPLLDVRCDNRFVGYFLLIGKILLYRDQRFGVRYCLHLHAWRWKQFVLSKHWYLSKTRHGVTKQ
jgi:hypothetical protein